MKKKKNWSCALEHGDYETNRDFVLAEGIEAVAQTAAGFHVNLVTPHTFGNPDEYITPILAEKFGNRIDAEFIDQCGCGGYVLKVSVIAP